MASPSRELVGLAVAELRANAAIAALVGDRIWYRAPAGAAFPYVADIDTFSVRADGTGLAASEITVNVHVWTRDGADPLQDARAIADAVGEALHGRPLALPTNRLVTLDHIGERIFYDRDGLTGHGVVEFRAITQKD